MFSCLLSSEGCAIFQGSCWIHLSHSFTPSFSLPILPFSLFPPTPDPILFTPPTGARGLDHQDGPRQSVPLCGGSPGAAPR